MTASLFMTLLFGLLDFGGVLYSYDRVASAARLGARWASVNTQPPSSDCSTPGGHCQNDIVAYILKESGLKSSNLTVTVTFGGIPGTPTHYTCASQPTVGCWVKVNLQYQFAFLPKVHMQTLTSSSQTMITQQYAGLQPVSN